MGILYNNLPRIIARLPDAASSHVEDSAHAVAEHAVVHHPWHNVTGETEASIHAEQDGDRFHWAAIGSGALIYLEWGTIHMPPFPTFAPAADAIRPKWDNGWRALERLL